MLTTLQFKYLDVNEEVQIESEILSQDSGDAVATEGRNMTMRHDDGCTRSSNARATNTFMCFMFFRCRVLFHFAHNKWKILFRPSRDQNCSGSVAEVMGFLMSRPRRLGVGSPVHQLC